jgi:hypothetical protein
MIIRGPAPVRFFRPDTPKEPPGELRKDHLVNAEKSPAHSRKTADASPKDRRCATEKTVR